MPTGRAASQMHTAMGKNNWRMDGQRHVRVLHNPNLKLFQISINTSQSESYATTIREEWKKSTMITSYYLSEKTDDTLLMMLLKRCS
jgi:hypothetical protein